MTTVLHQDRLLGLQSDFNVIGGVGARLDYPRGEASADTHPLIEFNDVGDGSSLPQDVSLGDRTQQTADRALQLPGEGRLCQSAPVPAGTVILHRRLYLHTLGTTSRACLTGSGKKMKIEPTTTEHWLEGFVGWHQCTEPEGH